MTLLLPITVCTANRPGPTTGRSETKPLASIVELNFQTNINKCSHIASLMAVVAGLMGTGVFADQALSDTASSTFTIRKIDSNGSLEIYDNNRPVLRYNYQPISEPPEVKSKIRSENRKYAVSRSDYIHPLYGLHGEILTDDWVPDHPHHRGIYWAWPEVDWQGQRGDLHALQQVFARPTGKVDLVQGHDFAEITAENEWRWKDRVPIIQEQVTIRVNCLTAHGRSIDLRLRFVAINDDVQVARRATTEYGGLNIRLAPVKNQEISTFADPPGTAPRHCWAQRTGVPQEGQGVVGLTILQNPRNPTYPGDWVQYPDISWVQPTFPTAGTRCTIAKSRPLDLRYRLWIYEGKLRPEVINTLP